MNKTKHKSGDKVEMNILHYGLLIYAKNIIDQEQTKYKYKKNPKNKNSYNK